MKSSGNDEETQIIPPTPPDPGRHGGGEVPLPSASGEETQAISPVEETRAIPRPRPSQDEAPTRLGMRPVGRGRDFEETGIIPPASRPEAANPAETTMFLNPVESGGAGYGKPSVQATPEDFGYVDYDADDSYDEAGTGTYDFSDAFPAAAQDSFTPPPAVPAVNAYMQDAYKAPETELAERKKGKGGWIALIIILALLACLGFGGWWWWSADRRQRALESCQQIQTQLTNASYNAKQAIDAARTELDSASYSQAGGELFSALQADVDTTLPVTVSCPVSGSAALLNSNAQAMDQAISQINSLISKTQKDTQALKNSQAEAALNKAKSSLSKAITSAKQVLAQNNGSVADPASITALQKALSQAESVEQDTSSTAAQMASAQTSLQQATEKVEASAQEYEQQKLQKLKQQAAQPEGSGSSAKAPNPSTSKPSSPAPEAGSGANSYNMTMAGPNRGNLEGPNSSAASSPSPSDQSLNASKKR